VVGVIGDLGGDAAGADSVRRQTPGEVAIALVPVVDDVAEFDRLARPADLVLMSAGSRPPAGWLDRLTAAARSDEAIATATPLGSGSAVVAAGSVAGVPSEPPDADEQVARVALRTRPRVLIGGPDCLYVRRAALDLIGGMPTGAATLAELTDRLCEACIGAGMLNVVADDLYVRCEPAAEPGVARDGLAARLVEQDRSDERSPLHRALALSRSSLARLSVTIDARALGPHPSGTQLYTLELARALALTGEVSLRMVVLDEEALSATRALLQEAEEIELLTHERAVAGIEPSEIVHRPQQVFSVDDLVVLRLLGRRVVVTHQDLIAYHNPTYHPSLDTWQQYRRVTRIALAAADRIVFFSAHSLGDAIAEDLVAPDRCDVVGAALDGGPQAPGRAPAGVPTDRDFIVCLGPDYRHKNRRFAIELLAALRAEQGWTGMLVLAGAHVEYGSSRAEEQALLDAHGDLRDAVVDLGRVDDAEREWLFWAARAVLVPSVLEGFGLIPLEAARARRPCLFAAVASLPEVISPRLATLVPWDASLSAARVAPLLRNGSERDAHLNALRADADRWRWDDEVQRVLAAYAEALRTPYRAAAVRAWQELEREQYLVELHEAYYGLRGRLGDRIVLAVDDGFLTPREQRGLMRVGSRPALARAVLSPFALLGALRRGGRRDDT
jgi:hypothetical protein